MHKKLDATLYKKQVVIFLDLLGIKDFIAKHEKNDQVQVIDVYQIILNFLQFTYQEYKDGELKLDLNKLVSPYYSVSALSDSIIITLDYEKLELLPILLRRVCISQLIFIAKGVPIRGHITLGKCYHDRATNLIFGSGLIDAYKKERDAITPRVVIDDTIINKLKKMFTNEYDMKRLIKRYQATYLDMTELDVEAFFQLATLNLQDSIIFDKTDKKWSTRLTAKILFQDHYYGFLMVGGKTLRTLLQDRLANFKAVYANTNEDKNRKVFEKWAYLNRMIIPILDQLKLQ